MQSLTEPLYVGRPNVGNRDALLARINAMLDRRWFSNNGPFVQEFERRVCEITGVRNCVSMCNATVALEIAIRALGFRGEVIVPSYTFIATAHALQWQEITPVFADVDLESHTIDPAAIERLITPKTTGIIGVHLWGRSCNTDAIDEIAKRHSLQVMYDAAHAFGCSHGGRMIGNFGACEVFSFHATKFINCFEGGAVVTNDDALAEKLRLMRNFGFKGFDNVIYLGVNGKLNEACAAMGLTSLDAIEEIIHCNRRNYDVYWAGLAGLPGVKLIEYDAAERNNYQYIVIEVDQSVCPVSRDDLLEALHAQGIIARKYFWPGCHRMEPYRSQQPNAGLLLPRTEQLAETVIVLPTGQAVDAELAEGVCRVLVRSMSKTGASKF